MINETRVYETSNRDCVSTIINTMVRDYFEEIDIKKEDGKWTIKGIK